MNRFAGGGLPTARGWLGLIAAVAVCAGLAGCGGSSGNATASSGGASTSSAGYPGGDAVPAKPAAPIRLTDYRGRQVDLSALAGKPVLVAFSPLTPSASST